MSRYKEYIYVNHGNKEAVQFGDITFNKDELVLVKSVEDTLSGVETYYFKYFNNVTKENMDNYRKELKLNLNEVIDQQHLQEKRNTVIDSGFNDLTETLKDNYAPKAAIRVKADNPILLAAEILQKGGKRKEFDNPDLKG